VLAADSQKLSAALKAGNRGAAGAAMAALKADAGAVDKAAASSGPDTAKWSAIKHDLDSLAALVPAAPATAGGTSPEPAAGRAAAPAVAIESTGPGGPSDLAVKIDSAQMVGGDVVRLKGSLRGRNIRSAGIYLGNNRLAKLGVKPGGGSRIIEFNIEIHNPSPGTVLRVYDSTGRSAQAPIMGEAVTAAEAPAPAAEAPAYAPSLEEGADTTSSAPDFETESNPLASNPPASNPPESSAPESNPELGSAEDSTREIPAAVPPPSGPKRRMRHHLRAHGPSDIRIRIDELGAVDAGMREYRVRGQIVGSNLERAGIYIDGRLAQEIPLNRGAGLVASNFAQTFDAVGSQATIRVYRARRDFTETSIDLGTANSDTALTSPLGGPIVINPSTASSYGAVANPDQLAVQITSVQPATPSVYIVNGLISGRNIASAGLYQNGVLIQPLNVSRSGGIGGLISGLIPGVSRQIPFAGRFNPAQGFATVRVFDNSGMMAEQPVMASGTPFVTNPYGAVNPYVRSPYGAAPFVGVAPGVGVGVAPGVGASRNATGPGVIVAPSRDISW
jgi:hypothetical protein